MAQEFVNSKIQPRKVVVFIKPACPYCRRTQELLSELPFKQGALEFVDITATSDTSKIQDYLATLTGARTLETLRFLEEGAGARRGGHGARVPSSFTLSAESTDSLWVTAAPHTALGGL
uniref:glutaredoxin-1 isoform X1 n=1 Tax=Halichoerus grypus TaxID=9711 RepID=UPI0016590C41|nr:glutaredoxin-1 isoform X1 [Halichoerus grypus]